MMTDAQDAMFFTVLSRSQSVPSNARSRAFLRVDDWNDWFQYQTLYWLGYADDQGEYHSIGSVKIGEFGLEEGRPHVPNRFDGLDERFFSVGQDDSYYTGLNEFGPALRDQILAGLRDVAADRALFERAIGEDVMQRSLLRSVSAVTVRGQYSRLVRGDARLTSYEFVYIAPSGQAEGSPPLSLEFVVEPDSNPPTNIHVLIGRNGVGKTFLLDRMARALISLSPDGGREEYGMFVPSDSLLGPEAPFANLVSVTFSAFDPFEPLPSVPGSSSIRYSYVGLKMLSDSESQPPGTKTPADLVDEFVSSLSGQRMRPRLLRWRKVIDMLDADPVFRQTEIASLADLAEDNILVDRARYMFQRLSSGHKIVLLMLTRLVELLEEQTLVLIDEPEAHLHPPLLSAFIRVLSDLLVQRNAVALVATHSPVVLQEIPRTCIHKLRRSGSQMVAERPRIETFGENVGVLTREVFELEVTHTGFHRLLCDAADETLDYESIVAHFDGQLGAEARAIARALVAVRRSDVDRQGSQ